MFICILLLFLTFYGYLVRYCTTADYTYMFPFLFLGVIDLSMVIISILRCSSLECKSYLFVFFDECTKLFICN